MKNMCHQLILASLLGVLFVTGCGKGIRVVDAGTYPANIDEVVPEEEEIYVTLDDGQRLELYFTDSTELVADGQPVDFSRLSAGMSAQLTVTREGNRNVPTRVEIEP